MKRKFSNISVFLILILVLPSTLYGGDEIIFWTTEVEKERLDKQNSIIEEFKNKTGITVIIVPVEENMLSERITAAAVAKSLPDLVFHPLDFSIGWLEAGILDATSATEVINTLGIKTFGAGPLKMVKTPQGYSAIPVDGWGQLLLYRKDLFKEKGLEVPDTWEKILKAAEALHNPPLLWGFEAGTDPGQIYTQQVFEHIALSNGVALTDENGVINLNTPDMVKTLEFYNALNRYSPPGALYWLHTRMDYLSGRAAMIIWSPFILDELSGLRQDQPVVPDIAAGTPGMLAKNTGFVAVIKGPNGEAQYGQMSFLGITRDADKEPAKKFAEYLLDDGYLKWLSMAPEGKLPIRMGTREMPDKFIRGWVDLEFGVTTKARISEFYGMNTVKTIVIGVNDFNRWGFAEGKDALISKIYGSKIIPEILKQYLDGEMDSHQAAKAMNDRIRALLK